jgi:hypothetical protein
LLTVLGALDWPSMKTVPSSPQSNLSVAARPLSAPTLVRMAFGAFVERSWFSS